MKGGGAGGRLWYSSMRSWRWNLQIWSVCSCTCWNVELAGGKGTPVTARATAPRADARCPQAERDGRLAGRRILSFLAAKVRAERVYPDCRVSKPR